MFWYIIAAVTVLPSCLSRRLMGGLIKKVIPKWPGTQAARVLWWLLTAVWCTSIWGITGQLIDWWYPILMALSWPLGSAVFGNDGMSLSSPKEYIKIAIHGIVMNVLVLFITAFVAHYWWQMLPSFVGVVIPLAAYQIAKCWPWNVLALECYTHDKPPTGEVLMGIGQTTMLAIQIILLSL